MKRIGSFWVLSASSLALGLVLAYHLQQRNGQQLRRHTELAWSLRRPDDSRLEGSRLSYLQGRFGEGLRRLGKVESAPDRDLRRTMGRCFLFDVPWPEQVLLAHQVGASQRPRLLARVTQSGFADGQDRVKLELLAWETDKARPISLPRRFAPGVREESEADRNWRSIEALETVHLERKDPRESQLWVLGVTRSGKQRLEILHGGKSWRSWTWLGKSRPELLEDRIANAGKTDFKLVDDDWVEVPRK